MFRLLEFYYPFNSVHIFIWTTISQLEMSMKEFHFIKFYLSLKVLMSTASLNLDSLADALREFLKVHKNTGEKKFAKYLSIDGSFVKTTKLLTAMTTMMLLKLKMNLCIAPTETSFCKLSKLCKNSRCFQKMVQLFNLMRIMLLV